ncbi:MAG: hypothetical protein LQ342_001504 [Letrouitia transgressa]|nr:MAG: hypothetical protein LQ342_001504 [Letrouitia transgressa]
MKGTSFQDSHPPSYEDSLQASSSSSATPPYILSSQRSANRTVITKTLLNENIIPHLQQSILYGLSKSTLLFVPSDMAILQPTSTGGANSELLPGFPGETIVDFPSSENPSLARLRGAENSFAFWRQQTALTELEQQLRDWFRGGGYTVLSEEIPDVKAASINQVKNMKKSEIDSYPGSSWSYEEERPLRNGEVRTNVKIREVCLRIENEMGLYETRAGKVVMVRVQLGD